MPNLEELIKIREEAIKKHIDANILEKFLFDCTKNYYDDFIVKKLTSQAEGDLKNSDISVCKKAIFITTTTDNKAKSNLFFDEIMYKDLKIFSVRMPIPPTSTLPRIRRICTNITKSFFFCAAKPLFKFRRKNIPCVPWI